MAALSTTVLPLAGATITFVAAAAGGDTCETGPGIVLHVKNGDATAHTVTLATPETVDGDLAVADRTVNVAAGAEVAIPVTRRYRDPTTGLCALTYSAVTSVTVAVVRAVTS